VIIPGRRRVNTTPAAMTPSRLPERIRSIEGVRWVGPIESVVRPRDDTDPCQDGYWHPGGVMPRYQCRPVRPHAEFLRGGALAALRAEPLGITWPPSVRDDSRPFWLAHTSDTQLYLDDSGWWISGPIRVCNRFIFLAELMSADGHSGLERLGFWPEELDCRQSTTSAHL